MHANELFFHSSQILTITPAMTPLNQTEMCNLRSGRSIRSRRAVCIWVWPRRRPSRKPGPNGPTRERPLWTGARNRKSSATSEQPHIGKLTSVLERHHQHTQTRPKTCSLDQIRSTSGNQWKSERKALSLDSGWSESMLWTEMQHVCSWWTSYYEFNWA